MPIDPREHAWFVAHARVRIAQLADMRGLVIAPRELWAYEQCIAAWLTERPRESCRFTGGDLTVLDAAMDYVATIFPNAGHSILRTLVPPAVVATPLPVRKIVVDEVA